MTTLVRILAFILAIAAAPALSAQAADLKIGPNSQRATPRPTCTAYPEAKPDVFGKVYRVPASDCDVADMTIAVRELGAFRPVYGPDRPGGEQLSADSFVDPVIQNLKVQAGRLPKGATLKILIFAHGGMVSHDSAIESAEALAPAMLSDGFQPIFLVWNSDFPTSYRDRLCCVRDGLPDEVSLVSRTGRLVGDVASSAARTPQNLGGQLLRFKESVIVQRGNKYYLIEGEEHRDSDEGICAVLNRIACPTIIFPPYADEAELNGRSRSMGRELNYTLLAPVRLVATFVGPEVGANAWDNMVRRTRMAFQRTLPTPGTVGACFTIPDPGQQAGFAVFFDRLACEIVTKDGKPGIVDDKGNWVPVELNFYGHSMGALVGNEALWLHPELPWRDVVYMAAASTIRDFRMAAAPTLARHPDARFFDLVLHPLNDSRELVRGGIAPQGSLLEWIDEMFEGPRSPDERMLGKWNNLRSTMMLIPDGVRARTTIRVFAKARTAGDECGQPPISRRAKNEDGRCHPVTHGEFNEFSFWRRSYLDGLAR